MKLMKIKFVCFAITKLPCFSFALLNSIVYNVTIEIRTFPLQNKIKMTVHIAIVTVGL